MTDEHVDAHRKFSQSVAEALTWIFEPDGRTRKPMPKQIRRQVLDSIREDLWRLEAAIGPHDVTYGDGRAIRAIPNG